MIVPPIIAVIPSISKIVATNIPTKAKPGVMPTLLIDA
jgi:hypothetical protein